MLALDRTDADVSLFLMTGNADLYGAPVTDPLSMQPYQLSSLAVRV